MLNILALTDLHYIHNALHTCNIEKRKVSRAPELIRLALYKTSGMDIDVITLLGDLTDNGNAEGAVEDLVCIKDIFSEAKIPFIVVRGNHDVPIDVFLQVFPNETKPRVIKGYNLIPFHDHYEKGDICDRNWSSMEHTFKKVSKDFPVITLQHNPVQPLIESAYPYNITDYERLTSYYEEKGVILSISGHAHWGINPQIISNVRFITVPSLCEHPHSFAVIGLEQKQFRYDLING